METYISIEVYPIFWLRFLC